MIDVLSGQTISTSYERIILEYVFGHIENLSNQRLNETNSGSPPLVPKQAIPKNHEAPHAAAALSATGQRDYRRLSQWPKVSLVEILKTYKLIGSYSIN